MSPTPLERLIDLIAPTECHICRAEGYMLCLNCRPDVVPDLESRCYLCNKLTVSNRLCTSCSPQSGLRRVWWLAEYDNTVKQLIHGIKYGRKRAYAREFGVILAEALPHLPEDTLICAVPTASSRIRVRGFDQANLIAREISLQKKLKLTRGLRRVSQADQIGKGRAERLKQMKSAFVVNPPVDVSGKTILLVDDVLTTGATIEAAALILRQAGAKHIDAAVVARKLLQ